MIYIYIIYRLENVITTYLDKNYILYEFKTLLNLSRAQTLGLYTQYNNYNNIIDIYYLLPSEIFNINNNIFILNPDYKNEILKLTFYIQKIILNILNIYKYYQLAINIIDSILENNSLYINYLLSNQAWYKLKLILYNNYIEKSNNINNNLNPNINLNISIYLIKDIIIKNEDMEDILTQLQLSNINDKYYIDIEIEKKYRIAILKWIYGTL